MSTVYEQVTEKITGFMESGKIPWVKPWVGGTGLGSSKNLVSKKPYRGINAFLTMGFDTPYFCTFKQAASLGASVKAGEKGIPIVFWGRFKTGGSGESDADAETRMFCRYYTVFNASQLDGLSDELKALVFPISQPITPSPISISEEAEALVALQKADIRFDNNARAFYSPVLDYINVPMKETFLAAAEYYSTLFHEIGHWTGHETRLKRKELTTAAYFGSHEYSQEELTAELTAAFVCSKLSISTESSLRNSAAYLQGWLSKLRNDPKMFCQAAQRAQKAADYIFQVSLANDY